MGEHSPPPAKRSRTLEDLSSMSKDDLVRKCQKQQEHIELLQVKVNSGDDNQEKDKSSEPSRRENVLVMRLANKEQEVQEYVAQINHNKKVQEDAAILSLRQTNLDPGINLLFGKMREELQQTKSKLEQAQSELSAWKFTPDSQNGKKLISRCRTLIAENQELGRQLSHGKAAQLEAELALQKKYSEELKASQDELNEFVIQLDEEVEGMQSTIQLLQRELAAAKHENEDYKKTIEDYDRSVNFKDDNEAALDAKMEYDDRSPVVSDANDSDNEADFEMADVERTSEGSYEAVESRRTSSQHSFENNASDRESDPENYITTEEINSPGTPTSENARNRTHASLSRSSSQERTDDVIDDVMTRSGYAWDDRTSDDDQVEIEVEHEEIASSSVESDDDIIKTHNQNLSLRTTPKSDSGYQRSPLQYEKSENENSDTNLRHEFTNDQDKNSSLNNRSSFSELQPNYESNNANYQSAPSAAKQSIDLTDKASLLAFISKNYPDFTSSVDMSALMSLLQNLDSFEINDENGPEAIKRLIHQILIQRDPDDRTAKEEPERKSCGMPAVSINHSVNGVDENAGNSN